jgi:branched-chain amino acid transport system permease protein
VGSGLSAGTLLIAPINMLIAVAPRLQNFTALLPGLAGIGLGRNPDGVVPYFRREWAPVLQHRIALALALAASAALWVLRLVGAVNGWVLFWGVVVVAVILRLYVATRPQPSTEPQPAQAPVPPEWLGLRRPWRAEDEEVLDRAVARG